MTDIPDLESYKKEVRDEIALRNVKLPDPNWMKNYGTLSGQELKRILYLTGCTDAHGNLK